MAKKDQQLADFESYWAAQGPLTRAQERWRECERQLRSDLAAKGEEPANWLIVEIRSGAWQRRQRRNALNMLRSRARLAQWRRDGYSFDDEHRLVAPLRIHAPQRREPVERPPERRARVAAARTGPRLHDDDPEPPDLTGWRGLEVASVRLHAHVLRRDAARAA